MNAVMPAAMGSFRFHTLVNAGIDDWELLQKEERSGGDVVGSGDTFRAERNVSTSGSLNSCQLVAMVQSGTFAI